MHTQHKQVGVPNPKLGHGGIVGIDDLEIPHGYDKERESGCCRPEVRNIACFIIVCHDLCLLAGIACLLQWQYGTSFPTWRYFVSQQPGNYFRSLFIDLLAARVELVICQFSMFDSPSCVTPTHTLHPHLPLCVHRTIQSKLARSSSSRLETGTSQSYTEFSKFTESEFLRSHFPHFAEIVI